MVDLENGKIKETTWRKFILRSILKKREGMGYELIGRDGGRYFGRPFIITAFVPGEWEG